AEEAMGCFVPPFIGPGEHLFEQAASIQRVVWPFTVRPDGIKDDRAAMQYIAQVMGIMGMVKTTFTGKALFTAIRGYNKPVLIFPLVQTDDDKAMAWVYPRGGLSPLVMSSTRLFGKALRNHLGGNEQISNAYSHHLKPSCTNSPMLLGPRPATFRDWAMTRK